MCSPTCCPVLIIINFVTLFTVFASLKLSCFQMGQEPGQLCFWPPAPGGLTTRITGFHPGYSGSISGQGTKIPLQDQLLLSLREQKQELKSLELVIVCLKQNCPFFSNHFIEHLLSTTLCQGQC